MRNQKAYAMRDDIRDACGLLTVEVQNRYLCLLDVEDKVITSVWKKFFRPDVINGQVGAEVILYATK